MSSPMKLRSSASFSPSIRISLRLKIHQAQAKNFCRVLDIRVLKIMYLIIPFVLDAIITFILSRMKVEEANEKLRTELNH